ncbi:MAG: hypothetical protein ACRD03_01500, partial [Acidimicrobiales bacterium]
AAEVVVAYRRLLEVESSFRVLKDLIELRPVFHWTEERVRAHVAICVLAAVIEALMEADLRGAGVADRHRRPGHLPPPGTAGTGPHPPRHAEHRRAHHRARHPPQRPAGPHPRRLRRRGGQLGTRSRRLTRPAPQIKEM